MKRILQVIDGMSMGGGIQTFIMNVYRNMDRDQVQFDFLLHRHNEKSYEEEILSMGGRIFYTPGRKEGIRKNQRGLEEFFDEHPEYDTVHFHASSLSYITPLSVAKKKGIPIRIMHSHNSRMTGRHQWIHFTNHRLNHFRISKAASEYLACGELAGAWMFGGTKAEKHVKIIMNGIDLKKFSFNDRIRQRKRRELGLNKEFVLCHAGRFEPVKNHAFLIEIFKELHHIEKDSVLLLIGDGRLLEETKRLAKMMQVEDAVRFLGLREDISELYQASDSFIFPSLYEGFPIAVIEAVAAGLPVNMSDTITKQAALKNNVRQYSLTAEPAVWARGILENAERVTDNGELLLKGLDIGSTVKTLMKIYGVQAIGEFG